MDRASAYNNQVTFAQPLVVENAPKAGAYTGDTAAVRVVASATPQLSFVSFFMSTPTTIHAEATAKAVPDPRYCLVSLEDGNADGFDFSGSAGVDADCGLMTNSRKKPGSIEFGGNAAVVKASEVAAVGGIVAANNWAAGTKLMPYQAKLQDPYDYAPPAIDYATSCTGGTLSVEGGTWNNKALDPGCWTNLSFKREVVLSGGTYVVKGGLLEFAGGANVTSTGTVTFILTGDNSSSIARLTIVGNAVINLTAPSTGPLKNILFYQDRRASHTSENSISGNASNTLNGAIYFPGSNLNFTGNATSTAQCVQLVGKKIVMGGNSQINLKCPAGAARDRLGGYSVRLVG